MVVERPRDHMDIDVCAHASRLPALMCYKWPTFSHAGHSCRFVQRDILASIWYKPSFKLFWQLTEVSMIYGLDLAQ